MSGSPLFEVANKPAVLIGCLGAVPHEWLTAIQVGLEEEGIPWEMRDVSESSVELAASELAKSSRINTGLVIINRSRSNGEIGAAMHRLADRQESEIGAALHHRDLPPQQPLIRLEHNETTARNLQRLGQNAARLVKGDPFILN